MNPFSVVYLSGGIGTRMKAEIPKQYMLLNHRPVALYGLECFLKMPELLELVVVCEEKYQVFFQTYADHFSVKLLFASPGALRQESVFNGIQKLNGNPLVCIHDSARPFIDQEMIRRVIQSAHTHGAATVGMPIKMTIKKCNASQQVIETLPREMLWEIQTPQVVRLDLLKEGFESASRKQLIVTDDVSLVELLNLPVQVVEGSYSNIKMTTPEDLIFAEQLMKKANDEML